MTHRTILAMAAVLAAVLRTPCSGQQQTDRASSNPPKDGIYREKIVDPIRDAYNEARMRPAAEAETRSRDLRDRGLFSNALAEAMRAEDLAGAIADDFQLLCARQLRGRILVDMGRYAEALPLVSMGRTVGGIGGIEIDVALCRLKLGDYRAAREYDVQAVLEDRYGTDALSSLPGVSTPTRLEASLWLARAGQEHSDYLASEFAMKAARLAPRCVAAHWLAAHRLTRLGQLRTARAYWSRAAALAPCRLQAYSAVQLRQYLEEQWKDRYPQGTLPPPANDKPDNGK